MGVNEDAVMIYMVVNNHSLLMTLRSSKHGVSTIMNTFSRDLVIDISGSLPNELF